MFAKENAGLLIYAKDLKGPNPHLQILAENIAEDKPVKVFVSVKELAEWLLGKPNHKAIVVLTAQNKDELSELVPIIHLFRKIQVVLMLPDREPETIRIGYRLEPRFLGFIDSRMDDIRSIFRHMLSVSGSFRRSKRPDPKQEADQAMAMDIRGAVLNCIPAETATAPLEK